MNPEDAISMSLHSGTSDAAQSNERDQDGIEGITLLVHIAGSGKLDRLVGTAARLCPRRRVRQYAEGLCKRLGAFRALVPYERR